MNRKLFKLWRSEARGIQYAHLLLSLAVALSSTAAAHAQVSFAGTQIGLAGGTWSAPTGAAMDGKGNLYIADRGNNRVVELAASGSGFNVPATILSGLSGPTGLAADWMGNVYLADTGNNRIVMLPANGEGFGTAVTIAEGLNNPNGVAVDGAGDIYIADSGNNRVVEILFAGGKYGTPVVVGTGFSNPMGVTVDTNGNLYIADTGNDRVVKEPFTASGYTTQQFLWRGALSPVGIYVDASNNLYIDDAANKRVVEEPWAAGANRYANQVVIGTGFTTPAGVVADRSGNVYVADSANDQVTQVVTASVEFGEVSVGSTGSVLTYNFSIGAGTALGGVGIYAQGVSAKDFTDAGGSTCLAQTYSSASLCGVNVSFTPLGSGTRLGAVVLFDTSGNSLSKAFLSGVGGEPQVGFFPGTVTTLGTQLSAPAGVAVDGNGNVYIADTGNNRVVELASTGSGYAAQTTLPVNGLVSPMGIAADGAGDLYIVSNGNDKVVKLPWTLNGYGPPTKVGTGFYGPSYVAVDAQGSIYVTNTLDRLVEKVYWTSTGVQQVEDLGNYHESPIGMTVDRSGNLYISDPYQNSVSEVPWTGTRYLNEINMSNLKVSFPSALAADGNSNLYVLDMGNNRVVMLPWTGSGFGEQVTVATGFNAPTGLAVDGNGDVYVADTGNNQVVKIDLKAPGPMNFANTYLGATSTDSARVAQVQNIGNQTLALGSVIYPANFPEDPGASNACTDNTSLDPSQWCELAVDFTPLAVGSPLSEAIEVTDNTLGIAGAQQSITVTGTSLVKANQTINFPSIPGATYGAAPILLNATASSGLPVTYAVVSGPGVLSSDRQQLILNGAGVTVVEAMQAGNQAFGAALAVTASIRVAPAKLIVTPTNTTAVYGSIPSVFGYSISGYVRGENAQVAIKGQATVVSSATRMPGAGSYVLSISQGTLSAANYTLTFATGTLTVSKAHLQANALSSSRSYGSPMQALAWNLTGFVNGDSAAVVTGAPVLTTSTNSGSPVGSYPILASVGTLTAANYYFGTAGGTLTVVPAVLTVAPANETMTYGGAVPVLTYLISGFVNGDTAASVVRGVPAMSTTANSRTGAGNYAISASLGTLVSANYGFKLAAGVLSIAKVVLQVSPANVSSTYGAKIPILPYGLSGFVNDDVATTAVTGAPELATAAKSSSAPGSYTIAATVGSLTSKNYSFQFGASVLTIGKAMLTVTAKPLSMTYGGPVPSLAFSCSGFVNGDAAAAVQGTPTLSTRAASTSQAGTYPIVAAAGTLASQKYTFNVVNGTITVNKAVLVVVPRNQSMSYGAAVPAMTYSLLGFVNGDSQKAATSGAPAISTAVAASSPVGRYSITAAAGSLAAKNYSLQFVAGSMIITKASLAVTANSLSVPVGSNVPALTYSANGLVNGDTLTSATAGAPVLSTSATTTKAGKYPIVTGQGNMAATNYQLTFGNGTLTVVQ